MPKKPVSVEIVRQPSPQDMEASLERLIGAKVKEKLEAMLAEYGEDQIGPVHPSTRIRIRHPGFERDKHALYFEKWGCMVCGRKRNVSHFCNARCQTCNARFLQRMLALEREWVRNNPNSQIAEDIDHLTRRLRTARALLGEGE